MMRKTFRLLLFLVFLSSIVLGQNGIELLHTFTTPALNDPFRFTKVGGMVRVVGDMNGDGFDDWAIGFPDGYHPETGLKTGLVYLFFGGDTPADLTPDIILPGTINDGRFGNFIVGADVNGDTYSDLIIRQSYFNTNNNTLVIFYGSETVDTVPDDFINAAAGYSSFAQDVSSAGDVNNDGNEDLLVNARRTGFNNVYLIWGDDDMDIENSMHFPTLNEDGYFGNSFSAAGDVNNDNYDDFLVGSPSYEAPGFYLYLGGDPPDTVAVIHVNGEQNTLLSSQMSAAGFINDDEYADFMVSAPGGGGGEVQIYYGGTEIDSIADLVLDWGPDRFLLGYQMIIPLGDIDNDGFGDVMVSMEFGEEFSDRESQVHLYYSPAAVDLVPDVIFNAQGQNDDFGLSLAAGNINQEGGMDIIIGAWGYTYGGLPDYSGYIAFYSGSPASIDNVEEALFYGASRSGDHFGQQVLSLDMNNDSLPEIVISAPDDSDGVVYIYQGSDSPDNFPELAIYGLPSQNYLGYSLDAAGDINNDGYQDLIMNHISGAYVLYGGEVLDAAIDLIIPTREYAQPNVRGAGDINNDGYDDFVLTHYFEDEEEETYGSRLLVYYGAEDPDNVPDITYDLSSGFAETETAGDVNNDGFDDLLLRRDVEDVYTVQLFLGDSTMDSTPDRIFRESLQRYESFGLAFKVNDINGDGFADLVITSDYDGVGGHFFTYLGDSSGIDTVADMERELSRSPKSLTLDCDINNDNINDIIIGTNGTVEIFYGGSSISDSADLRFERGGYDDGFGSDIHDILGKGLLVGAQNMGIDGLSMGRVYVYGDDSLFTPVVNNIMERSDVPVQLTLYQNYPNPFNPNTTISYKIANISAVELSIYNMLGQKVATLVDENQAAGNYSVQWNARGFASGVYFYKLKTKSGFEKVRKLVLLK